MKLEDIETLLTVHDDYWNMRRGQMKDLTDAYMGRMFDDIHLPNNEVTIETSDAYAYVESLVASTFSKQPALEVGSGPQGKGEKDSVEACVNQFLYDEVDTCEKGLRYALIYPMSFFKLALRESDSLMNAVTIRALKPWDVIVDHAADNWDEMRYVGHRYSLPISEAKKKFNVAFAATHKEEFLKPGRNHPGDTPVSDTLGFVEVVELYDLTDGTVTYYSKNLKRKNKVIKSTDIPFVHSDGTFCAPIVPVYLAYAPDFPLQGYSTLSRVYDQLFETNSLRTVWANSLRRNARMYVARAGAIDDSQMQLLTENVDQSIIQVSMAPGESVMNLIQPLTQQSMSPDFSIYKQEIRNDLERGSILAPFTRGSVTQATATEIEALTQYSATELGRISRFFHLSMERVGQVYQTLAHFYMENVAEQDREVVIVYNKPVVLDAETFQGKFRYAFADQAASPMTDALKRRTLTELAPTLASLGVDSNALLKIIVKLYDLPESLLNSTQATGVAAPPVASETPSDAPQATYNKALKGEE